VTKASEGVILCDWCQRPVNANERITAACHILGRVVTDYVCLGCADKLIDRHDRERGDA